MSHHDIEPLEPVAWLTALDHLTRQTPRGEEALVRALRRAFHLVQLAPRPLRHVLASSATEADFEGFLAKGALLQAVEALVGEGLGSGMRTTAAGEVRAEVRFIDGTASAEASAPSAALALFAAWSECLRNLIQTDPAAGEAGASGATSPDRRKSRSEPHPRLTEH